MLRGDVTGHEVERVLLAAERALGAGVGLAEMLPNGTRSPSEVALGTLSRIVGIDVHLVVKGETNRSAFAVGVVAVLLLRNALLRTALLHMNLQKEEFDYIIPRVTKASKDHCMSVTLP